VCDDSRKTRKKNAISVNSLSILSVTYVQFSSFFYFARTKIFVNIGIGRSTSKDNKKMNQQCKVCGEPAAGFHFGAFTCEGCKVSVFIISML
jgi:hypothetical protein